MKRTGDQWLDIKTAQAETLEREASRALEKPVRAGMKVERIHWQDERAFIDDLHYFEVPQAVWNLQVNGFQVIKKWLMDRRTILLSQEDIDEYEKVILLFGDFIQKMKEINMQRYIEDRRYINP